MCEIQKKIELLQKIAHRFNEANIEWALGASMLLYFKGILSEFHDIDLMVSVHDAEQVRTIFIRNGRTSRTDLISGIIAVISVLVGTYMTSSGIINCK